MSGDSDLINLYSARILGLAAGLPAPGRLEAPDGSATLRAPLCGSTVTVDLTTDGGVITDYAASVRACALGQAAASVVAAHIVGRRFEEVIEARDALREMLRTDGPAPRPPFDGLDVLRAARPFENRHASIMLALDAAVEALSQVRASA
ncbi:MAG: iron-sulfur cluster assembly scaffold protein [Pseudomonadota bacterium]